MRFPKNQILNSLRRISLFVLLTAAVLWGKAQAPVSATSNFRVKKIAITADSTIIDTVSVVPNTFTVVNVPDSLYRLDGINAVLYWKSKPALDSVFVTYRVFPYKLNPVVQRASFDSVMNNFYLKPFEFNDNNNTAAKGLFDFGNLQYNGSFGRGISFGNNQDAVVNSNFNLQLNGLLGDSIEIAAAISDNNIPIQPDGTTQQLNEFDQVFLQFKKRNWQLNLGDIDIRQNEQYFLNFYKRLEGISFQTTNQVSKNVQAQTLVSGSIAKGKFTRNVFQGLEGNQGPYRLTGANNEFFFIVLAGTERVFLDGELLQRGEDQDYVINYNTAEVTFTPRHMITKDSRIQIEFEYADRNYLNANLYAYQSVTVNNKLKLKVGAFTNSDAKNSTINQTLDARQRQFLYGIGDSIQKAYYPTAAIDTFSSGKILYERVYDTINNMVDSFYRYTADPATAKYSLSFSDVGPGNGNYEYDATNSANGKVYRYISPVNGAKQGRYEPVTVLVTPKKQQLISFGADYTIDDKNSIRTEMAVSSYDVNTFSPKDGGDDKGLAAKVQYANTTALNKAKGLTLISTLDYEHVQAKFKPLERLRQVEFSRDWGLPLVLNPATETIVRLATQLKAKNSEGISYQFTTYERSDNYKGYQNVVQHMTTVKGWLFNDQLALTSFHTLDTKGAFFRPAIDISKQLKQLAAMRVGFRYSLEQNKVQDMPTDSLSPLSFSFDTYTAYIKSNEALKNTYGITFYTRSDKYPVGNAFVRGDRSYNVNLETQLLKSTHHQLMLNTTFRKLQVYNKSVSRQTEDQTVLGRAEYVVNEWKGLVTGNVLYELGTGQEQKRNFVYLEVPAGQGEYTWIDYNNDGVQQLNEFEIAVFRDQAKFIRIFTPTNEFVKANYTTLNYSLTINPQAVLNGDHLSGMAKFISKFNLQSSMQKSKKSIAKNDFEFNPFKYDITDTALLTLTTSLLNTLSFNRFNTTWGIDLSNIQNTGKSLLTYGYESRRVADWMLKWRWNISSAITLNVNTRKGINELYTPNFSNRNYQLNIYSVEPQLVFISGTVFRLQGSYRFDKKNNAALYGGEQSLSNSVNLETKYNVLQNSSVNARFTYNKIDFTQPGSTSVNPANTAVGYMMLDALLPGSNYLWSVDFTKRLLNNVEINFQYEGRKPAETRMIHTGRASIRALF